jgi:Ca2+-binding EF-hand superfamily protein
MNNIIMLLYIIISNVALRVLQNMTYSGSGDIDFDEFVSVMTAYMPRDENEQIRQAFSMIDKDGSGKISSAELKNIMRSIGEKLSDEEVEEIIRDIDLNGDGELDYEGMNCSTEKILEKSRDSMSEKQISL